VSITPLSFTAPTTIFTSSSSEIIPPLIIEGMDMPGCGWCDGGGGCGGGTGLTSARCGCGDCGWECSVEWLGLVTADGSINSMVWLQWGHTVVELEAVEACLGTWCWWRVLHCCWG